MCPVLLVVLLLSTHCAAQAVAVKVPKGWTLNIAPNATVTIVVPMSVLRKEIISRVEQTPTGLSVNGVTDWARIGFPPMIEAALISAKFEDDWEAAHKEKRKAKHTYVTLAIKGVSGPEALVGFYFKQSISDVNAALRQLVIVGPPSSPEAVQYLENATQQRVAELNEGPFAAVTPEKKLAYLKALSARSPDGRMGVATYKERMYLALDLGDFESAFNTLRSTQASRIAHVVNHKLLDIAKEFVDAASEIDKVQGVKITVRIKSYDFVKATSRTVEPDTDIVELYFPLDVLRRFRDADITSQQMLDGSVVIDNGNRVQVNLAAPLQ